MHFWLTRAASHGANASVIDPARTEVAAAARRYDPVGELPAVASRLPLRAAAGICETDAPSWEDALAPARNSMTRWSTPSGPLPVVELITV